MWRIKTQRFVFNIAGIFLPFIFGAQYLISLFDRSFEAFLTIAATLFATLAVLTGLTLRFYSCIEAGPQRDTIRNAGEKLLHGILFLSVSVLYGYFAMTIRDSFDVEGSNILHKVGISVCGILAILFLVQSFFCVFHGLQWLSDVLWSRWEARLKQEQAEQGVAPQSATRAESKPEADDEPQPESEERSR